MTWFVFAVIAAFCVSLSSIIEKRTLVNVHSIDFAYTLAVIIAVVSIPVFFFYPLEVLTAKVLFVGYMISIAVTIAFIEVTKGVRHMEISASAPLFLLSPFMTAMFAFLFLDERLSSLQLCGMALLAIGTYVLETEKLRDIRGFFRHITGEHYARLIVFAMFLYALTSVAERLVIGTWLIPPVLFVGLLHMFILFNFILLSFYYRKPLLRFITVLRVSWKPFAIIALLTIASRVAYAEAVALTAVGLVVATKRSSSLFTTVIGGEMFHDHHLMRRAVACTIMITGVALLALN